jgi:hypothetical protein
MAGATARAEAPLVGSGEAFRVDGYTSFEFERQLGKEGKGDPNGSFDMDLFDLVLNWRGSDRLRIAADVTWEHGAATEDGRGNVAVEYAFAEYTFADWARVRAGKMFTPFGIYNEIHTAKPVYLSVKEPLATNKNDKFGSGMRFYPRWGAGVALLGNGHLPRGIAWDYVVAVTNGEQTQTNPFEEDDNKQKAFQGRARLTLLDQLELGASFYTDRISQLRFKNPLDETEGLEPTGKLTVQSTFGAQATWRSTFGPGIELEWVRGRVPSDTTFLDGRNVWGQGATAMIWWALAERVTPYARVEWIDPDESAPHDQAFLWIGGLNVQAGGGLVIKAELDKVRAQNRNARFEGGQGDYAEVKLAAVVGF